MATQDVSGPGDPLGDFVHRKCGKRQCGGAELGRELAHATRVRVLDDEVVQRGRRNEVPCGSRSATYQQLPQSLERGAIEAPAA